MRRLRIFTWHIHGSYLYYFAHIPCDIYLPVSPERKLAYSGKTASYPWPNNLYEIPIENIKAQQFDCILFQSRENYLEDQYHILSESQRQLPRIYLEHDPPREVPSDTKHWVDDPNILLVHVTHFNRLMWDNNNTPSVVIEHGVPDYGKLYRGMREEGVVVINNIRKRGRRLGFDIFEQARKKIALHLIGMGWEEAGGYGEIAHHQLVNYISEFRFFFNPIRYTSLGLAVCEAMMAGIPIVGLATTELSTVIKNEYSGFISTDPDLLCEVMAKLIQEPKLAKAWGEGARETALQRFQLERFCSDWLRQLQEVTG